MDLGPGLGQWDSRKTLLEVLVNVLPANKRRVRGSCHHVRMRLLQAPGPRITRRDPADKLRTRMQEGDSTRVPDDVLKAVGRAYSTFL